MDEELPKCQKCGKPTPRCELEAYGGQCEDCYIGRAALVNRKGIRVCSIGKRNVVRHREGDL